MKIFNLQVLNYLYNPASRVWFFFLLFFLNLGDSLYQPLSFGMILFRTLIEYFLFILLIEIITDIFLNRKLNKKQRKFISTWLGIITFPIAIVSAISIFVIFNLPKDNALLEISLILFSFFMVFNIFKSVRYSLILTIITSICLFVLIEPLRNNIIFSLLGSFFIIEFLLRYSEANPLTSIEDDEFDNILKKHKKDKERRKEIMIEGEIFSMENKIFLKKEDGFFDSLKRKVTKKKLQRLSKIKSKFVGIEEEKTKIFIKRFIPKEAENNNEFMALSLRILKKFKVTKQTHFLMTSFTLLFFNRKAMRRFSKKVIDSYESLPDNKLDSKFSWVSDLELDIINEQESKDFSKVNILLNKFIEVPSDYLLSKLGKTLDEYLRNAKDLNYKKVTRDRLNEGKRVYGKYRKMVKSYENVQKIFKNNLKQIESIKKIILTK